MNKILVIAPHADDEVLGCGGTILKHILKGDKVDLCIVTDPYFPEWTKQYIAKREKEINKVAKLLKIEKIYRLNFPAVKLDTISQKILNDSLEKVFQNSKPNIVYIPFAEDLNFDHRIVSQAALVPARPFSAPFLNKIVAYETLSETEWGFSLFRPNYYENIENTLKIKISAMKLYKQEIKSYPHLRSIQGIKTLAAKRGSESGCYFAEAFIILREIVK